MRNGIIYDHASSSTSDSSQNSVLRTQHPNQVASEELVTETKFYGKDPECINAEFSDARRCPCSLWAGTVGLGPSTAFVELYPVRHMQSLVGSK